MYQQFNRGIASGKKCVIIDSSIEWLKGNKMYSHKITYETLTKVSRIWVKTSFPTTEDAVSLHVEAMINRKNVRNIKVERIIKWDLMQWQKTWEPRSIRCELSGQRKAKDPGNVKKSIRIKQLQDELTKYQNDVKWETWWIEKEIKNKDE